MRLGNFLACVAFWALVHTPLASACADVLAGLSGLTPGKTSMVQTEFPLVSEESSALIFAQMQDDLAKIPGLAAGFFTQLRIAPDGMLSAIYDDQTVKKEFGESVLEVWNKDPRLMSAFRGIYARARDLEAVVAPRILETRVGISEVIFSYQIRKPPEGWHLDWYDSEYLVATQAFVAQREDGCREPFAGTEYLFARGGAGKTAVAFGVNTEPVIDIYAEGCVVKTRTGQLAMHSGVRRVENVLGPAERYTLVSPAHRGPDQALAFRGAIVVRFAPR